MLMSARNSNNLKGLACIHIIMTLMRFDNDTSNLRNTRDLRIRAKLMLTSKYDASTAANKSGTSPASRINF